MLVTLESKQLLLSLVRAQLARKNDAATGSFCPSSAMGSTPAGCQVGAVKARWLAEAGATWT